MDRSKQVTALTPPFESAPGAKTLLEVEYTIAGSYVDQGGEIAFKLSEPADYGAPVDVQVRRQFKVQ